MWLETCIHTDISGTLASPEGHLCQRQMHFKPLHLLKEFQMSLDKLGGKWLPGQDEPGQESMSVCRSLVFPQELDFHILSIFFHWFSASQSLKSPLLRTPSYAGWLCFKASLRPLPHPMATTRGCPVGKLLKISFKHLYLKGSSKALSTCHITRPRCWVWGGNS